VDILLILLVILIVVLAVRGPAMLPRLGQALGRGVKDARKEIGGALKDDPAAPGDQPRA
jgi:Sec-independent protein translocase protein TatA